MVRVDRVDPLAEKRAAKTAQPSAAPAFGAMADEFIAAHEPSWRSGKHTWQWKQTLGQYAGPLRDIPVNEVATADVLAVLKPLWTRTPETGSRLRGRIEAVIDMARALGHIDPDKANPARWKGHLDHLLPPAKKLGVRGHHAAMPYADLPAFMAKLSEINTTASRALAFTILTCARTSETIHATWDEIDFQTATWGVALQRMKMQKPHDVPLSEPALNMPRRSTGRARQESVCVPRQAAPAAVVDGDGDAHAQDGRRRVHRPWLSQRRKIVDGRHWRRIFARRSRLGARRWKQRCPSLSAKLDARTQKAADAGLGLLRDRRARRQRDRSQRRAEAGPRPTQAGLTTWSVSRSHRRRSRRLPGRSRSAT
jgi:integrase